MKSMPTTLADDELAPPPKASGLVENIKQMQTIIFDGLLSPNEKHAVLRVEDVHPDTVFGLDEPVVNARGVVTNGKTRHEVWYDRFPFKVASTVGQVSHSKFTDTVLARVFASKVTLEQRQPGNWAPIGFYFTTVRTAQLHAEQNPAGPSEDQYGREDPNRPSVQKTIRTLRNNDALVLHLAWWETTGAAPYDFLAAERNFKGSPIARYAETREIARMPNFNRKTRADAEYTHLRFWNDVFRPADEPLSPIRAELLAAHEASKPKKARK